MTTSPTLADLRVQGWIGEDERPATREDIIAVLGGIEVPWCVEHGHSFSGDIRKDLDWSMQQSTPCLSVPHLIVPLEES